MASRGVVVTNAHVHAAGATDVVALLDGVLTVTVRDRQAPGADAPGLVPDTDPLLTVTVGNESPDRKPRRVCVKAFIEGLSAEAVRTVEIKRSEKTTLKLLPTLFPERARAITEIQRATLHLRVEDLDGKPECHDTFPLVCLARTSSFNAVRRPDTGQTVEGMAPRTSGTMLLGSTR